MVLAKTSNFSLTNNESPIIFSVFFYEFRSGACWARLVSGKYRKMLQKKTSILYSIFDFRHFSSKTLCSYACLFRKKCNGHETGVFLEKKIKKVQKKKTSTVNSLFLILVIYVKNIILSCFL